MEAVRDRPRDMFTASRGTEGTDMCVVTLRAEESMYSLGRGPLNPGRQGGLTDKGGLQVDEATGAGVQWARRPSRGQEACLKLRVCRQS